MDQLTPQEAIAECFGINKGETDTRTVFVYAQFVRPFENRGVFELIKGNSTQQITLTLTPEIKRYRDSQGTEILEIPIALVETLRIANYVLDDNEIERRWKHFLSFNSPFVPTALRTRFLTTAQV